MEGLTVSLGTFDEVTALQHWRWLVPESYTVFGASVLGDLFLTNPRGRVFWLDVGSAELTEVTESVGEFNTMLASREHLDYSFGPALVEACETAGLARQADECYSYVMLPILGGGYSPANIKVRTLENHLVGWGPICEKVAELPDGAQITFDVTL